MTDVRDDPAQTRMLWALFAVIGLLMAIDVADDARTRVAPGHLLLELAVIALALVGVVVLWREAANLRSRAMLLTGDLRLARADAERWREEAEELLSGMGAAIERQFARWNLTAAEREVGMLLLRGLSHKEIAVQRSTSERTVRQQALAVYRKAEVRSRSELSAFFLAGLPGQEVRPAAD